MRSVIEKHIEIHHILAGSYKYILSGYLGKIVAESERARRHTNGRNCRYEEDVGNRQKLADELVSSREHRL